MEARLWRVPVRAGFLRMLTPKWTKADQAARSLLLTFTLFSKLTRRVAQAGLADFGMCLIIPPTWCGWEKVGGVAAIVARLGATTAELPALTGAAATVDGVVDDVDCRACWLGGCDANGGLLEPGQRLSLGPCRLMVPSFLRSWRVAWQQLHTPLALFAVWDRVQV